MKGFLNLTVLLMEIVLSKQGKRISSLDIL